ncbi:MAG: hypothetical protein JSS27_00165 [Planctomycetes bacterium]|nr:hypothetical protein [Planctomycetota bacterium]
MMVGKSSRVIESPRRRAARGGALGFSALAALMLGAVALTAVSLTGCGKRLSNDAQPDKALAEKLRAGGGAGAAAATAQATGTGWCTLKGKFTFDGAPPAAAFMSTANKDAEVCGAQVPVESLVVDAASKGISNVFIYARKVSRVKPDAPVPGGSKPEFDQKKCLFSTHLFATMIKLPIVIKNSDSVGHNTNIAPPGNPPANFLLPAQQSDSYTFTREMGAPSEVTCNIHPWMKAFVVARKDPYFAVTSKDGSFEIANLPAGETIEFQVWHERAPGGLTAGAVSKGRFKLKIGENETKDVGEIKVPAGQF